MQDKPKSPPQVSDAARAAQAERDQRRAEALRANLRRRKTQERGRDAAADAESEGKADSTHKMFPNISDKL